MAKIKDLDSRSVGNAVLSGSNDRAPAAGGNNPNPAWVGSYHPDARGNISADARVAVGTTWNSGQMMEIKAVAAKIAHPKMQNGNHFDIKSNVAQFGDTQLPNPTFEEDVPMAIASNHLPQPRRAGDDPPPPQPPIKDPWGYAFGAQPSNDADLFGFGGIFQGGNELSVMIENIPEEDFRAGKVFLPKMGQIDVKFRMQN